MDRYSGPLKRFEGKGEIIITVITANWVPSGSWWFEYDRGLGKDSSRPPSLAY